MTVTVPVWERESWRSGRCCRGRPAALASNPFLPKSRWEYRAGSGDLEILFCFNFPRVQKVWSSGTRRLPDSLSLTHSHLRRWGFFLSLRGQNSNSASVSTHRSKLRKPGILPSPDMQLLPPTSKVKSPQESQTGGPGDTVLPVTAFSWSHLSSFILRNDQKPCLSPHSTGIFPSLKESSWGWVSSLRIPWELRDPPPFLASLEWGSRKRRQQWL